MNFILDGLPSAVCIDEKAVAVNTDFRVALRILQAFDDERLCEHEKLLVMLTLLYPEIPENTALAITQGLKFLNIGKDTDEKKLKQPQIFAYEKDSKYIYSAFKSCFNIDLSTVEYMHWWTFQSLFADLGECFFTNLCSIRRRRNEGKLTEDEKRFVRRNPEIVELNEDYRARRAEIEDFISKIGRSS